jgi:hypothetical protein
MADCAQLGANPMNAFAIIRVYGDLGNGQGAFRQRPLTIIAVGFAMQFNRAFRQTRKLFSRVEGANLLRKSG